ncbi:2-amino-3-ketobutyrate coenzyme A ligase, mitochondrial-like isoform X1 [Salvelinus namaycush]|uniref:2-amino-3-ketobutyrate coenzyme A ligase, mitochondrial-like isoform X1 n=1 Tax=Salvelinus namaycush TaxID=8040 RepID=A0A8U0QD59_SALNM|nr:2-amino-3-ketobutyrate coenzyme A ligase, mitochondrial-like isoform X1 [Salvelinus namaycush]
MLLRTAVRYLSAPIRDILRPSTTTSNRGYAAIADARSVLEHELEMIRTGGTWKGERIITSKQGPHINVDGSRGDILNFCANNYLGISSHPHVVEAGIDALKKYGAGLSSVRFICGTQIWSRSWLSSMSVRTASYSPALASKQLAYLRFCWGLTIQFFLMS